ncbi:MAG: hypothetical protein ACJ790_21135, partial [Myxococcaceae bacterium]
SRAPMHKFLAAVSVVVLAAACATPPKPAPAAAKKPEPTAEQQKIQNLSYFDVAVCDPTPKKLSAPLTDEAIVGALLYAQPHVLECVVDSKNRGEADQTTITVDTTVDASGAKHTVGGQNLNDSGKACVEKALEKTVSIPALGKDARPVKGHVEFQHHVGTSPSVKMGINEPSDIYGKIRLAQPSWCDCYESYKTKVPPSVEGNMDLGKGKPANVTAAVTGDDKLASCLNEKVKALNPETSSDELKVPLRMFYTNSRATSATDLPSRPDLAFTQLDLLRGVRSADVAIAIGQRKAAAEQYDAVVTKYQKTKDYKMLGELKSKCAALTEADKAWISSVKSLSEIEDSTHDFAQKQKATDASWAEAEAAAAQKSEQAKKDLDLADKQLKGDEAACPKAK